MIVTMLGPDARPYQGPDDQRDFRHGCRCIIERDGMILFSYMKNRNQYLLPGGGLEGNESFDTCVKREALEEQGVKIGSIHWFGSVEDCYTDKCYRNEYCSAVIEGEGFPTSLVPEEVYLGLETAWLPKEHLVERLCGELVDLKKCATLHPLTAMNANYREASALAMYFHLSQPEIPEILRKTLVSVKVHA